MIPILYDSKERNFNTNGIGILIDAISCEVTEERNGAFELVLKYPQEGQLSQYIKEDAIIKAKPNDTDEAQLFRMYKSGKPIAGANTWYAEHISYELNANPLKKLKITGKNAQEAIAQILEDAVIENEFTAWSDITTRNSTEIDEVISVRKAFGGIEGSVLDVWGGEYRFNNFRVELHKDRGADKGVEIRYGKNMIDAQQEKNITDVTTAVFPYAYYTPEKEDGAEEEPEEVFVTLPEKTIRTPNADKYARIRCQPIDFSEEFEDGTIITEAMLRNIATKYAQSGIDEPKVNITASFANLWQTKEYETVKALEKVGLCDTVTVIFDRLGIAEKAKIVKYSYDVLRERYNSVDIGEGKTNLTKEISKQEQATKETIVKTATRSEIIKKQIEKTIRDVTAAITGNSGGHVVLYPPENPQEIFIMDTDDTATAKNVWRWNLAGLGHSSAGIGGPFTTAITADGQIVADFITAGKLTGMILEAGTVKAESLDILYRQSVTKYTDDAKADVLTEMKSQFKVTNEEIAAEVKRSIGAEKTISDDLALAKKNVDDFKEDVQGAFRDGVITEAEAYSISNYINELKKDYNSIDKQYEAITGSMRTTTGSGSNLSIKFNAECKTEMSSDGQSKYDYVQLFYVVDGVIYRALEKASGADIAGKTYIVPSTEIYIYWYSDSSNHNYYGFSIDNLARVSTAATITGTTASLPVADCTEAATATIISTSHPYSDNERKLWHYKADNITKSVLSTKKNTYTNAYNSLISAINSAILDKKITEAEKTNVNSKFDAYNNALAAFKEALQNAGVDIAARAAAGVAEYAAANFTVTADKITAEIERSSKAEGSLKASIEANAKAITLKVTENDVTSLIEQKASSIRLKATTISWSSTYSSMSSSGILKCSSAELRGTMKCGSDSGYWVKLESTGRLTGGNSSTQYGYIDYSASAYNTSTGVTHKGIQIQGGCLRISVNELATRRTSNTSTLAYVGATGTFRYISRIDDNGDGTITWWNSTVSFENGLMVSEL